MMDRKAQRRSVLTTAGVALTGLTAGCLGGGGGDDRTTIQYLSDRGASSDIIDDIVSEFETEHSEYEVDVTYTSRGTTSDQQLQQMRAAGNPPDLIFDTSADAYRYQRNGNAAVVSDAVESAGLPDPVNVEGESYFAPAIVEPLMGWYREDIYETNPGTWEEWQTEARRISENEDMEGYILPSGQTNNADTQLTQYFWENNVDIYTGPSNDIQITIDDENNRQAAIETLEWVQRMAEYAPNGSGWEWGDCIEALQQENAAALMSVGGLPILSIRANRPELATNLAPTSYPSPEGVDRNNWWAYMEGHVVWAEGTATEGAREFVRFFSQSERFLDFVLSEPLFQLPPTVEQLDSEQVTSNPVIQEHMDALELARENWDSFSTPLETGDNGAPNIIAANAYNQQVFGQAADQLLVGGKSPEATVDWLASELRELDE